MPEEHPVLLACPQIDTPHGPHWLTGDHHGYRCPGVTSADTAEGDTTTPATAEDRERIGEARVADVHARCICNRNVYPADFDPNPECPIHGRPPVTAEPQPGRRYRLSLEFGAADDQQAERLGMAWAGTCAAEYGTRNPVVTPVQHVTAEGLRERAEAAVEDWFNHLADNDEPTVEQIGQGVADAVLAALAGDPGDLPARMEAAIARYFADPPFDADLASLWRGAAQVAMSVRWEDHARQTLALEDARIDLTTAQGQLTDERAHSKRAYEKLATADAEVERLRAELAEVRRVLAEEIEAAAAERIATGRANVLEVIHERDALKEDLREARAAADAHLRRSDRLAASLSTVQDERDALKAAIGEFQATFTQLWDGHRQVCPLAALDAPASAQTEETTDGR